MKTKKIQRTFYEDDEMSIVMNAIDEIIWAYVYQTQPRDPAEIESRLSNKVKVTFEIYGEQKPF